MKLSKGQIGTKKKGKSAQELQNDLYLEKNKEC